MYAGPCLDSQGSQITSVLLLRQMEHNARILLFQLFQHSDSLLSPIIRALCPAPHSLIPAGTVIAFDGRCFGTIFTQTICLLLAPRRRRPDRLGIFHISGWPALFRYTSQSHHSIIPSFTIRSQKNRVYFRYQLHSSTMTCANIFALKTSSSTTANSSAPCIRLSVPGRAAP